MIFFPQKIIFFWNVDYNYYEVQCLQNEILPKRNKLTKISNT